MSGSLIDSLRRAISSAGPDRGDHTLVEAIEDALLYQAMAYVLDAIRNDEQVAKMRADIDRQIAELRWSV